MFFYFSPIVIYFSFKICKLFYPQLDSCLAGMFFNNELNIDFLAIYFEISFVNSLDLSKFDF
jgi:hypothetical protein